MTERYTRTILQSKFLSCLAISLLAFATAHDVVAEDSGAAAEDRLSKCPVMASTTTAATPMPADKMRDMQEAYTNQDWWPNQLDLSVLH